MNAGSRTRRAAVTGVVGGENVVAEIADAKIADAEIAGGEPMDAKL